MPRGKWPLSRVANVERVASVVNAVKAVVSGAKVAVSVVVSVVPKARVKKARRQGSPRAP